MTENPVGENRFSKSHLAFLHGLKNLLEKNDLPDDERQELQDAVQNVLKKKQDVGNVIVGLQKAIMASALSSFKKKNYKSAKNKLFCFRTESHGNTRNAH